MNWKAKSSSTAVPPAKGRAVLALLLLFRHVLTALFCVPGKRRKRFAADFHFYSETRVDVSRNRSAQVDATSRERRPSWNLLGHSDSRSALKLCLPSAFLPVFPALFRPDSISLARRLQETMNSCFPDADRHNEKSQRSRRADGSGLNWKE
jgi:hypothetical protein